MTSGSLVAERSSGAVGFVGPLRPGNSGGPVLDPSGAVIGIVSGAVSGERDLNVLVAVRDILPMLARHNIPFFAAPTNDAGYSTDAARRQVVRVECE